MPIKPIEKIKQTVGDSRTTVEGLKIEVGKIEEFARAIGDDNPAHRESSKPAEQGSNWVPAPLTFTRTGYFPRYRPRDINNI